MALKDGQLIEWLSHPQAPIRSAALELLSNAFSTDHRWCDAIFRTWDQYTPQEAFPEFPLISHLEIPKESMESAIQRASTMSVSRALTDRACRCAGKIIEAISVSSPWMFQPYLEQIRILKQSSKIFFRVDIDRMAYRVEQLRAGSLDPIEDWFQRDVAPTLPYGYYPHLESAFARGEADSALRIAFDQLKNGDVKPQVIESVLELSTRYRLVGYESIFVDGLDHDNTSIADACAIALSRCRNDNVLSLIADRFPEYTRAGQLRSIDVLRRSRLPKTSELLRFLRPHAQGGLVQNALRIAEIMQFDFDDLENWLEAMLVVDDSSMQRIVNAICLAGPLSEQLAPEDRRRTLHLVNGRMGNRS
jgi:hypothetical protein